MKKYALALGSNLGDRRAHLTQAVRELENIGRVSSVSPLLENPPWLPENAPSDWFQFFLNSAVILETELEPDALLAATQKIEHLLGRPANHPSWSPRTLDIDLIFELNGSSIKKPNLELPHPQWEKRNFVLAPLTHLIPQHVSSQGQSVLDLYRAQTKKLPALMAIVNVTPDSFSQEKNAAIPYQDLFRNIKSHFDNQVAFIDIGAESTRPGARALSAEEEWQRLEPILTYTRELKQQHPFTQISIDTYHPETARRALDYKVDLLNDVQGFENPAMRELAPHFRAVIAMHSLTVPSIKNITWPKDANPVALMKDWLEKKITQLAFLKSEQLFWDPGFCFGKTSEQSLHLVQNFSQFKEIPVRSVLGHSRKSFMNLWSQKPFAERDPETLALSETLIAQGADVLRVHNPQLHQDFFKAKMTLESP